mgnify:CR=1 FL=1
MESRSSRFKFFRQKRFGDRYCDNARSRYCDRFLGGVAVEIFANSAIDMIYDNTVGKFVTETTDNMMKTGKEVIDGVGNVVSDFFSGIGTVF